MICGPLLVGGSGLVLSFVGVGGLAVGISCVVFIVLQSFWIKLPDWLAELGAVLSLMILISSLIEAGVNTLFGASHAGLTPGVEVSAVGASLGFLGLTWLSILMRESRSDSATASLRRRRPRWPSFGSRGL